MKKRFFLPMMAFVFAIGLSFATERSTADPYEDYYLDGTVFKSFGTEVPCGNAETLCRAQETEDSDPFVVYDAPAHGTEKMGSSEVINLWEIED